MECCCYLRSIQDFLFDGKTLHEREFGIPFNGPIIPFGAMVEYHLISAKVLSRLHQFGPKVMPGVFLGYALHAWRVWKGDMLIGAIEELEQMDSSELHARRLIANEVLTPMSGDNFMFPSRRWKGEEQDILRGESDGLSSSTPRQDDSPWYDGEANVIFGLLREISFVAITWNPSGHDAAEVCSPEVHRHAEANATCETHKGYCTSYQNSRPKSFARIFLPR